MLGLASFFLRMGGTLFLLTIPSVILVSLLAETIYIWSLLAWLLGSGVVSLSFSAICSLWKGGC